MKQDITPEIDVRRTLNVKGIVSGQNLADAVRELAAAEGHDYVQRLARDFDGKQAWVIGIRAQDPDRDVYLLATQYYDEKVPEVLIDLRGQYGPNVARVAVCSADFGGEQYVLRDNATVVIGCVETVRVALERMLNRE